MLTLEEQILFIKERKDDYIKVMQYRKREFAEKHSKIFREKINENIFYYDSVLSSLRRLQNLKNTAYDK